VAQVLFGIGMLAETALARLSELDTGTPSAPGGAVDAHGGPEDRSPLADVLRQMRDMATRGGTEIRRAIYALNEPGPSRRGLAVSLRAMLADLAAHMGTATHFATPEPADGDDAPAAPASDPAEAAPAVDELLPMPVAEVFYKVAREALANVERHAAAPNVWVELRMRAAGVEGGTGRAELVVRDDGRGFRRPLLALPGEPDEDELGYLHFGLGNMRRAVESVGGRLEITTAPGRGTTVHASAPMDAAPL
jgi:signal transduction histidine kinase